MVEGWILDWSTMIVLAAIVVLEGVRRVPPGAIILRRVPGSGWSVADGQPPTRRWGLASWGAPAAMHVVVEPDTGEPARGLEEVSELLGHLRWRLATLRVLGGIALLGIVMGVPTVAARFGGRGLLASLVAVFGLSIVITVVSGMTVRHVVGASRGATVRAVRGILSPFAAPRAAEIVLERAMAGVAPLVAARVLVGGERFARWVRPGAYDLVAASGRRDDGGEAGDTMGVEIERALSRDECRAIVETPPAGRVETEPYCPRCGDLYRDEVVSCTSCDGVPLRR